ncbi:MAG: glycosyltransferase family 4 protein [Bacteroidota bacterium]
MLKVLQLNDKVGLHGGVETYLSQLIELLPEYGVESVWMGWKATGKNRFQIYIAPSEEVVFEGSWKESQAYFIAYLEKENIDLLHLHSISDRGIIETAFAQRPVFRSMHEPRMFCPGQGKFWRYSEDICTQAFGWHCIGHTYTQGCANRHPKRVWQAMKITRFEIKQASQQYEKIIAMSDYMKKEAVLAGILPEQIEVNPYFTPTAEANAFSEKAQVRMLYMGRIIPHKGVHLMLEAVRPLLTAYPHLRLDILGDGTPFPALEHQKGGLEADGTAEQVRWRGWQDRAGIQEYLSEADICIFPSIYPEAFGISGIEAMMRGIPVIGFDVGGVSTWLKDRVSGWLIPRGDVQAMGERLKIWLDDPVKRKQMGENARELALEKFTAGVHLSRLTRLYHKSLSGA